MRHLHPRSASQSDGRLRAHLATHGRRGTCAGSGAFAVAEPASEPPHPTRQLVSDAARFNARAEWRKADVLALSAEDGLADTIRPRLDAARADPAQVITITQIGEGADARPVTIPGDLPAIEPSSPPTTSSSSSSTCSWPTSLATSTPTVTRTSAGPCTSCPRSPNAPAAASSSCGT